MHRPVARLKIAICGAVQGVGFRPFVYRLAQDLHLAGWVNNSPQGVLLEVEGPGAALEQFLLRLEAEKPPNSFIQSLETSWLDAVGYDNFEIRESGVAGGKTAFVLPDIATCADCLREIQDPQNRRYRYPFTNCTHCGPRFSLIESLPYDRANTSMKRFVMCPQCQAEYDDPADRRFHAQPNACPLCGPHLELWDNAGRQLFSHHEALTSAAEEIRQGRIVAVKGLGGFHLMVAAHDDAALRRLRELKRREEKPFALMFPGLDAAKVECKISPLEERLLRSASSPIVLLRRRALQSALSRQIAPGNPFFGIMLPYTPLHCLLMGELGFPVVATSGNLSDEPICIDEREALERLGKIAEVFLVHNRPIVRPVDDSVVRILLEREMVLRRARGYGPLPIEIKATNPPPILAVGAHLKNTVALSVGSQAFVSQHIGDLETLPAREAFLRVIADFQKLYDAKPAVIAADAHPDYLSTKFANEFVSKNPDVRFVRVQHHLAHVFSCMAENKLEPPALGVAWDGTGHGSDGTVWGGEFFLVTDTSSERVAHFRQFQLPGGDKAVKEPRRAALGLLYEIFGEATFKTSGLAPLDAFSIAERDLLKTMLKGRLNSPLTSSAGRLFDAIAALIGLRQQSRFEGQAAMELEFSLEGIGSEAVYPLGIVKNDSSQKNAPIILDWEPMARKILADLKHGLPAGEISARFHNTMAEAIVTVARHAGKKNVALSGGCFQNCRLTERTVQRLREEGFRPYWHQRVPPNDGGIALGQVVAALREL